MTFQGSAFTLSPKSWPAYPLDFLPSGFSCLCPLQSRACISSFPSGPVEGGLGYSAPRASYKHLTKSPPFHSFTPFIALIWVRGPRVKGRRIMILISALGVSLVVQQLSSHILLWRPRVRWFGSRVQTWHRLASHAVVGVPHIK